ncbi:DNA-binding protein [Rhodoferax sp. BLA1]|uniref:DNA-binding protein n=1 Tax=Rhodoferax sp. BLA1 TaxID=2576062 RepID=UPI00210672AD|nr:DNA-binding protein [Rhodoferax sp. BLA1]
MAKRPARQPVHQDRSAPVPTHWPAVDDELMRTLPPVLRAIVRALGFGRARELLEERGGAPIWIPVQKLAAFGLQPDEMQRLRVALEPHLNETRRITLPKVDKLFLRYRNEQILRDRGNRSAREIAQIHALTTRQVLNIFAQGDGPVSCRGQDEDSRQPDLFA